MEKNTREKRILVTGACGGMGGATVRLLIQKGFRVFAVDKVITNPVSGVDYYTADCTSMEELTAVFEEVKNQTDYLDGIVHFSGIYNLDSLLEIEEGDFVRLFDINLFGCYRVNKLFSPLLKRGSRVVITSSELAPLSPLPFTGLYAVSKCALESYAESLRMELNLLGVSLSILRPGAVKTGLLNVSTSALDRFTKQTKLYRCNAERFKKIVDSVEAKNVPPEQVAKLSYKALTSRKPRYVYNLNRNPLLRLLNVLPRRMQVWIIGLILKDKNGN
jgi:NAD(P)-dependent dehydrogenase (short-subunit alcohol dehydrogenase family)